ncbi:hypothetical protein ROZALSC1DRAFT_26851 [Rozella allomycis CSF55]|uniref:PH domain-containing protein n=1 Tax=Rozella allomycis (strain CSF55) TaxID=988480 RepID=A0A075ATG2_ROZAC|nr:hypothetical protein O9G_001289 [Rozella allomycis CSF55]RKP21745.1 hypothetical protein ROZALSC1DRAFT_26851 [Rozella allomycis CSF55]|eukprot:EPZ33538.1 hypothetical protein O9G_001289 [Rozella allomycis CSF55]
MSYLKELEEVLYRKKRDPQKTHTIIFEDFTVQDLNTPMKDIDEILDDLNLLIAKTKTSNLSKEKEINQNQVKEEPIIPPQLTPMKPLRTAPEPPKKVSQLASRSESLKDFTSSTGNQFEKIKGSLMKKATNFDTYKTLVVTTVMTCGFIVQKLRDMLKISQEDYYIYELCFDFFAARPLRYEESLMDVLASWEEETENTLLFKKCNFPLGLTISDAQKIPMAYGYAQIEGKRNKWNKRFIQVTPRIIFHYKDANTDGELLCDLINFEPYKLTEINRNYPTKNVLILKSTSPLRSFELIEDYIKFICFDSEEKLNDWLASIRFTKLQLIKGSDKKLEKKEMLKSFSRSQSYL